MSVHSSELIILLIQVGTENNQWQWIIQNLCIAGIDNI